MASRFNEIVTTFAPRAQVDLGLKPFHAAGLFGNGDVESAGFATLQEITPLVQGSRGGFGWFQWTGPRRREYEAWCVKFGYKPSDDEANYQFMLVELRGSEKAALAALKRTISVDAAAKSVCDKYLRPGIPHLDKRLASARRALALLAGATAPVIPRKPVSDRTSIPDGQWAEEILAPFEVEAIQKRLRALGYFMVGKVDGKWGPATKAALIALQTQARIIEDGHWGPETKAALADDANKRIVPAERANATASDLRQQGSVIAIQGNRVTWSSVWQILIAGLGVLQYVAANWSGDLSGLPWPASFVVGFLPPWAAPVLVILLNVYNALAAQGIVKARVVAERTGLHNGEPDPAPSPPVRQASDAPPLGGFLGSMFGAR